MVVSQDLHFDTAGFKVSGLCGGIPAGVKIQKL